MTKKRIGSFLLDPAPGLEHVREYMIKHPLPVPPTVRECAVQGISPYGLRPSRTSMSPSHTRELVERYPGLYRHADDKPVSSCDPFAREGFACGDGWFGIVDQLSSKLIADPNLVVGQLKEKMGLLTIYFDPTPLAIPEVEAATDAAYDEAREESRRICELCGDPGMYKARGKRISSLCVPCEWLDEIEEACCRLLARTKNVDLPVFASNGFRLDAAMRHVRHIGQAASYQSPKSRARFPAIDWPRLDTFRSEAAVTTMSAAEVWRFVREEVPSLAKALR